MRLVLDRPPTAARPSMARVKRSIGAGEVLPAIELSVEFHAIRNRSNWVLGEILDDLLDVFLPSHDLI